MIKDMVFTLENSSFVRFYTSKVSLALDASDLRKQSSKFLMNFYIGHIILCRSLEKKTLFSVALQNLKYWHFYLSDPHCMPDSWPRSQQTTGVATRATPSRAEQSGGHRTPFRRLPFLWGAEVAFWARLGPVGDFAGGPYPTKLGVGLLSLVPFLGMKTAW